MTDLELFFTKPEIYKIGKVSTLHLLRRDIYNCLGKELGQLDTSIGSTNFCAIWPGIILILTGIDLIAKFYSGQDNSSEMGSRFRSYVEKFIDHQSEEVYQLRNALLHGFSLYSTYRGSEWRYVLGQHANNLLWYGTDGKIWVSANQLHKAFENSISDFENEYQTLNSFNKFNDMFNKYGWTTV